MFEAQLIRGELSPPLRGGEAATSIKMARSLHSGADGVVSKFRRILLRLNTTPSARAKDASRHFLDRAATPPQRGGENSPRRSFRQHARNPGVDLNRAPLGAKESQESVAPPGLIVLWPKNPGLAPGANICRRYAALFEFETPQS